MKKLITEEDVEENVLAILKTLENNEFSAVNQLTQYI